MKKFASLIVLLFVGLVGLIAQHTEPNIVSDSSFWTILYTVIAPIIAVILGVWKVFDIATWSKPSAKLAQWSEKLAGSLDGLALILDGAGLEKASTVLKEASDPFDELGDMLQSFSDHTVDGEYTKEEIQKDLELGKEVVIEGVDFKVKVFKKKE